MTRLLVALLLAAGPAAAAERRPNVVVFYTDDMGYADLGCYGGKLAPTPHADSLAKNGVRFTDGYVSACVCSPSASGW
jgi:arylsulfatase A-like enzyme